METIKVNGVGNVESIMVRLSRDKFPIAFRNKVDELMEQGAFNTREEAETWVEETPFELELYYDKGNGLFGVESDAIENGADIVSPYDGTTELEYQ